MKKFLYIISLFPILPTVALAQTLSAQGFIKGFLAFSNKTLIPALIGIAFLLFVINVIRFFVIQGGEEDGRKNAKNLAVYSVLAFVILIVFWGVVNLLAGSLGFNTATSPTPDYLQKNDKELKASPGTSASKNTSSTGNNKSATCADGSTPDIHGACGDPIGDIIEEKLQNVNEADNRPLKLLPPESGVPTESIQ